jgi:hypothetical protein
LTGNVTGQNYESPVKTIKLQEINDSNIPALNTPSTEAHSSADMSRNQSLTKELGGALSGKTVVIEGTLPKLMLRKKFIKFLKETPAA